jgi:beta-glucosidase-like glycosyl hydrolase
VLPVLRWSEGEGYGIPSARVQAALAEGAQGFILFGGNASAAREAADVLASRAGRPLLLGADLERGAGQQFLGATPLPPLAALGAAGDLSVIRAAGNLTGREAVALGVPWVFAPVADLAVEPDNPIVGTRAFGDDPNRVADQVVAWIEGCLAAGAIPCVKHFPGHGRTRTDSHAELPVVSTSASDLQASDLVPFRRAVEAGVPSVMTAHVSYPSLDPSGRPATRSPSVLRDLLRGELAFQGVVVTDALIMEGVGKPERAVVEALAAGVDVLLYPPEELDLEAAIRNGLEEGILNQELLHRSSERLKRLLARRPRGSSRPEAGSGGAGWGHAADRARSHAWAMSAMRLRDWSGRLPGPVNLTVIDDDLGGPYPPPSREPFQAALRALGVEVAADDAGGERLLCVYAEPRAWKGRAGLSPENRDRVRRWHHTFPGSPAVIFGGPRILADLPASLPALLAWGGEPLMQEAAARVLAGAAAGGVHAEGDGS